MAKPSLMGALADSPPDSASSDGDKAASMEPGVQAAQSILDAIQDGDAESLFDALTAFCDMHSSSSPEDGGATSKEKPKLVIAIGHGPSK